jgi:hypothetical protein
MPQEPRLQMLPDKAMKLSGSTFRKIVRRIESIVPLAGDRITVTPKDGGYEITADEQAPALNIITLNVCLNGAPSTIEVYGPFEIPV